MLSFFSLLSLLSLSFFQLQCLKLRRVLDLFIRPHPNNLSLLHNDNIISKWSELDRMGG
jgi:hypothetical protein